MSLLHVTSAANVEATLNALFVQQLGLIELPPYITSYTTVANWPENKITPPCFSFIHMPITTRATGQTVEIDGVSLERVDAMLEISAWVNKDMTYNGQLIWQPALQYMASMVRQVKMANPVIQIQDYQSDASYPAASQYVVHLGDMDEKNTLQDPNPAIKRRRMCIYYWWNARVNTT